MISRRSLVPPQIGLHSPALSPCPPYPQSICFNLSQQPRLGTLTILWIPNDAEESDTQLDHLVETVQNRGSLATSTIPLGMSAPIGKAPVPEIGRTISYN